MKTTALMRTVTAEDLAARNVLVPPELKEVTFTEVKNFLNARCDYEARWQDYSSKQRNAQKITPMGLKFSMSVGVLNLICRWQLKLDPADGTQEARCEILQDHVTRNAQSQVSDSMQGVLEKMENRRDINEPDIRLMVL